MEDLLLELGSCSGRMGSRKDDVGPSKIDRCGLQLIPAGGNSAAIMDPVESSKASTKGKKAGQRAVACSIPCAAASPAHLVCRVLSVLMGGAASVANFSDRGDDGAPSPMEAGKKRDRPASYEAAAAAAAAPVNGHNSPPDTGHTLFLCKIEAGWVKPQYWHDGKLFGAARPISSTEPGSDNHTSAPFLHQAEGGSGSSDISFSPSPPLLCFAGSQRFVHMYLKRGLT